MAEYTYIKFEDPSSKTTEEKTSYSIIKWLLGLVFPKANSISFERQLADVKIWLIEIDMSSNLPNREIGLSNDESVLLMAPDNENYGFWTDSNMTLSNFYNQFNAVEIDKNLFNSFWDNFITSNNL